MCREAAPAAFGRAHGRPLVDAVLGAYPDLQARLLVNSSDAAIDSALEGHGVTCVLSYQVERELREERLVRHSVIRARPPTGLRSVSRRERSEREGASLHRYRHPGAQEGSLEGGGEVGGGDRRNRLTGAQRIILGQKCTDLVGNLRELSECAPILHETGRRQYWREASTSVPRPLRRSRSLE
jgi:DNA-binding transcriptional LysR family regulator